jgi:hypothetical protein
VNWSDLIGWCAASMTLLAFTSRDVHRLRLASLGASVAFITYGAMTSTWPVLALHCALLPINIYRLAARPPVQTAVVQDAIDGRRDDSASRKRAFSGRRRSQSRAWVRAAARQLPKPTARRM